MRTVGRSVDGFHWKADNSQGEKGVQCCFPGKGEAMMRLTSPGTRSDGYRSMAPTAHNVTVDRLHHVCTHANTGNTSEVARDAPDEIRKPHQLGACTALGV